jgi:hypothetical protein
VRQNSDGSYFNSGTQHFYAVGSGFGPACGGAFPPCQSSLRPPGSDTDDQLASRGVTILAVDLNTGQASSLPVEILRLPVVMIHGLWSNWKIWNNFNPLVSGNYNVDPRFYIGRITYDRPVAAITASDPPYSQSQLQQVHANSLGFGYNAPLVVEPGTEMETGGPEFGL